MAGITLAAVGVPEVMGYTKIIETPVITGLYTMFLPVLVFAIFGSSRHLVVAADSATAVIVATVLASIAVPYSPRYVALTALVALVAGGMLLLARLFRLGFLTDFLSRTVLVGFLTGVGIQVAFGQLGSMLGLEKGEHGFLVNLFFTFQHLPETHWLSAIISLCVLGIVIGGHRIANHFPGALLAVAGAIAVSFAFHLEKTGIRIVGEVPAVYPGWGYRMFRGAMFPSYSRLLARASSSSWRKALPRPERMRSATATGSMKTVTWWAWPSQMRRRLAAALLL